MDSVLILTGAAAVAFAAVLLTLIVTGLIRRLDRKTEIKASEERILKYTNQQKSLTQRLDGLEKRLNVQAKSLAEETRLRQSETSRLDSDFDVMSDQFPLVEDFTALVARVDTLERDPKLAYRQNGATR